MADAAVRADQRPVGFVVVQQGSAPIQQELPGRVAAYQVSDVRPQVSGVIQRRLFREGSIVRQGQTLYQIDPSIYRGAAAQAAANLQSARASADAARTRAARYAPLAKMEAISKQDYTDARRPGAAGRRRRRAEQRRAARRAQINMRFTRVPAPISGRIGLSNVTEGALVTANQADALATITRLDPVYRRHPAIGRRPARRCARRWRRAAPCRPRAQVRLKLPDGIDLRLSPARSSSAR